MKYLFHNFINTLKSYKTSSLLNIIGMAVAFTAFYIILTQLSADFNYNKKLEDSDRICLVTWAGDYTNNTYLSLIPRPLGDRSIEMSSGIEAGGIVNIISTGELKYYYKRKGDLIEKIPWTCGMEMTPGGKDAIGMQLESGSFELLGDTENIAVSSRFAAKYSLGIGDLLSQTISDSHQNKHIVAIFKDFPKNTTFSNVEFMSYIGSRDMDNTNGWNSNFLVKFSEGADKETFLNNLSEIQHESIDNQEYTFDLISLKDVLFSRRIKYESNTLFGMRNADYSTDISLLVVAILILLIALVNYINFFFALVPVRVRNVNTYKIFGMTRAELVVNFILESVGTVILSLMVSGLLAHFISTSSLVSILPTSCALSQNPEIIALTIASAIFFAAVGSIYPALYITSFPYSEALKGCSSTSTGKSLRTFLICFQFTVTIALIIIATFVNLQHRFMVDYELGFNSEQLITGAFYSDVCYFGASNEAFEDALRSDSRIKDIAWSDGDMVAENRMGWGRNYHNDVIHFQCYPVSFNFLDFMDIDIVRGRDFLKSDEQSEGGVIIFNEEADRRFGIEFDMPFTGHSEKNTEIAGVCRDFHFAPLKYGHDPFAFYVFGKEPWSSILPNIFVRTNPNANPFEVIEFIKETATRLDPDLDPDLMRLTTFDESLASKYQDEHKLSVTMTVFAFISIIISLMGVFGIVLFDTQYRSKEIAVRRVLGAKVSDILNMLNRKYAQIVLACFAIAAPASYLIIEKYLSSFANRTPVHVWVYAATLICILIITVIIVTLRSLKYATENPVKYIKGE